MFIEEHLDLFLVDITHFGWRYDDLIAILVGALLGDLVDLRDSGAAMIEYAEFVKVFHGDGVTRIVILSLISLRQSAA